MRMLLSFIALILASEALSQDAANPPFIEKFKVGVGFFSPINNTNIRIGVTGNNGSDVDFESDLGFAADVRTFMANGQWRITRRSRLNLAYYQIDRSSTHTLTRDITFGDNTYSINASINAYFNTNILQFSYGYALLSKPKYEAGLLIGAHVVGGEAGMSLNTSGGNISSKGDYGFTAPLPDLGIWGSYAFSDRFYLTGEASYLSMTVNGVTGSIYAYTIGGHYRVVSKLDLFLGFTGLNTHVGIERAKWNGDIKWSYNGPSFAVTYSFGNWRK